MSQEPSNGRHYGNTVQLKLVSSRKENNMKTPEDGKGRGLTAPGCPANDSGTRLKRGAAVQVMTYPRPKSKSVLVEASRKAERSLSSFMVLASLKEAAAIL